MNWLVVSQGTSFDSALSLAQANDCVGWYTGIPPVYQAQAAAEGWVLPCVVIMADDGTITSWMPV
jgi:hypothetical protein